MIGLCNLFHLGAAAVSFSFSLYENKHATDLKGQSGFVSTLHLLNVLFLYVRPCRWTYSVCESSSCVSESVPPCRGTLWGCVTASPLPRVWWSVCVLLEPCSDGPPSFLSWRQRATSALCASTPPESTQRRSWVSLISSPLLPLSIWML